MNLKQIGMGIVGLVVVVGAAWGFMINSYEEDVGTNNIFTANDSSSNLTNERNNSLFELSFSSAEEDLEWSKLSIRIQNETETMDCSKGNFTSKDIGNAKVSPKLSSDGITFSVMIDATSEEEFTHVNLNELKETDQTSYDIRFSKTDIYLSENVTGIIVEDKAFEEVTDLPDQDFTETSEERLDWYDYKITTHRIEVEDKIYIVKIDQNYYKIKFTSYYNEDDEPRYVSFMIGAIGDTEFAALSNPELVSPAKCTIIEFGEKTESWEISEKIAIFENDFNICNSACVIKITVTYEGVPVKGTSDIELN